MGSINSYRVIAFVLKRSDTWFSEVTIVTIRLTEAWQDSSLRVVDSSNKMTSADETSALKRNSVHQTRLSLELQQLEKDKMIRLREMQKASQAFARRQEQIQGIRDKASLRRVPSAPVHKQSRTNSAIPSKTSLLAGDSSEDSTLQPFVTKAVRLESAPASNSRRTLHKTLTMPSLDLLPSRRASSRHSPSPFPTNHPAQKATSPKFTPPLDEKPNSSRVPMYSRNFCAGLRNRDDLVRGLPMRKSSLPVQSLCAAKNERSKSLST